jgi:glycosyltransferase involved in cell wall biosynthesis
LTKSRRVRGGGRLMKLLFGEALGYWRNGPCVKGMLKGIREMKPDIIMGVMDNAFTTYICYVARKKFDIPFVFMPITHVVEQGPHHIFLPKIYAMADRIIACTDFEKQILIDRGVAPEKITVLPIGIASEELDGHDARRARKKYGLKEVPTVAYIGRIVQGKGVDTLIDAMKIVWQSNPDTQLLLAGRTNKQYEGKFRDKLRSLNEREQAETVYVEGFDEEDKKDLFAAADIMAMVSSVDCFGLVYLESWLCGVPVIAARDSPQSCIVDDGENGLLVKYNDEGELSHAILKLLDNPEMGQKYGQNGRQKVDKCFQIDQYARNLHNVYKEVLSQKTGIV